MLHENEKPSYPFKYDPAHVYLYPLRGQEDPTTMNEPNRYMNLVVRAILQHNYTSGNAIALYVDPLHSRLTYVVVAVLTGCEKILTLF